MCHYDRENVCFFRHCKHVYAYMYQHILDFYIHVHKLKTTCPCIGGYFLFREGAIDRLVKLYKSCVRRTGVSRDPHLNLKSLTFSCLRKRMKLEILTFEMSLHLLEIYFHTLKKSVIIYFLISGVPHKQWCCEPWASPGCHDRYEPYSMLSVAQVVIVTCCYCQ